MSFNCPAGLRQSQAVALRSHAEVKYLEALEKLAQRVKAGKLKAEGKIQRDIGRLQQKHPRVQRFYQVELPDYENVLTD